MENKNKNNIIKKQKFKVGDRVIVDHLNKDNLTSDEIIKEKGILMEIDSYSVLVRFDKEYEWMHGYRFGREHSGHCWWLSKSEIKKVK